MMFPSIPDSFNKIIIAFGVALIIYSNINWENKNTLYLNQEARIDSTEDLLYEKAAVLDHNLSKIKESAKLLSTRNNLPNPIQQKDSLIYFNRILAGNSLEQKINDSIWQLYNQFLEANFEIAQIQKKVKSNRALNTYYRQINELQEKTADYQIYTGLLLILMGIVGLYKQQSLNDKLITLEIQANPHYINFAKVAVENLLFAYKKEQMKKEKKLKDSVPNVFKMVNSLSLI